MVDRTFNYDETSDTLYVSFEPGEGATGIELNDHILLRIDRDQRKAIGLTFFDYSMLAQKTEGFHITLSPNNSRGIGTPRRRRSVRS